MPEHRRGRRCRARGRPSGRPAGCVAPLVAQSVERGEEVVDDRRREAERRLVEQQEARLRHQAARDRQHLLLAAREQTCAASRRSRSRGKRATSAAVSASTSIPRRAKAPSAMLSSTESSGNTCRPSGTRTRPSADDLMARQIVDPAAGKRDSAVDGAQEPADGAHEGRLAGAVRAEHGDQLALSHVERHPAEHRHARRSPPGRARAQNVPARRVQPARTAAAPALPAPR